MSPRQTLCFSTDEIHTVIRQQRKKLAKTRSHFNVGKYTAKKRRARRAHWINKYKIAKGCTLCGYNAHHTALDFDHINPLDKELNIARNYSIGLKKLIAEIRKCRILCANCHRIETYRQNIYYTKRFTK